MSKQCKVSRPFVRNFFTKLEQHGKWLIPDQKRWHPKSGAGANKLDEIDAFVFSFCLWKNHVRYCTLMPCGWNTVLGCRSVTVYFLGYSTMLFLLGEDFTDQTLFHLTIFPIIVSEHLTTFKKLLQRSFHIALSLVMRKVWKVERYLSHMIIISIANIGFLNWSSYRVKCSSCLNVMLCIHTWIKMILVEGKNFMGGDTCSVTWHWEVEFWARFVGIMIILWWSRSDTDFLSMWMVYVSSIGTRKAIAAMGLLVILPSW